MLHRIQWYPNFILENPLPQKCKYIFVLDQLTPPPLPAAAKCQGDKPAEASCTNSTYRRLLSNPLSQHPGGDSCTICVHFLYRLIPQLLLHRANQTKPNQINPPDVIRSGEQRSTSRPNVPATGIIITLNHVVRLQQVTVILLSLKRVLLLDHPLPLVEDRSHRSDAQQGNA